MVSVVAEQRQGTTRMEPPLAGRAAVRPCRRSDRCVTRCESNSTAQPSRRTPPGWGARSARSAGTRRPSTGRNSAAKLGDEHDLATQAIWRQVQALVHAHRGEQGEAEALARQAVAITERTDSLHIQGDALSPPRRQPDRGRRGRARTGTRPLPAQAEPRHGRAGASALGGDSAVARARRTGVSSRRLTRSRDEP
jgi:hypothetical protein